MHPTLACETHPGACTDMALLCAKQNCYCSTEIIGAMHPACPEYNLPENRCGKVCMVTECTYLRLVVLSTSSSPSEDVKAMAATNKSQRVKPIILRVSRS